MSKPRDLILSYATHAKRCDLNAFFASARRFCDPDAVDIVVIINPMGMEYAHLADKYDVQLYPANSIWREIRDARNIRLFYRLVLRLMETIERYPVFFGSPQTVDAVHRSISHPWIYAQAQRFLSFEDFLNVRSTYRMIMLTDARDVVFQQCPFIGLDYHKLHVALQTSGEIYGADNLDSRWMKEVLGLRSLARLRGKVASCCGTIIGGYPVIMDYLSKLSRMIIAHKYRPVEQPMHNQIIHFDIPPDRVLFHDNAAGPFITLGGMSADELELGESDLRMRGRLVPVVHMYDRIPETKALFERLYACREDSEGPSGSPTTTD
jgi:hypothetical protein